MTSDLVHHRQFHVGGEGAVGAPAGHVVAGAEDEDAEVHVTVGRGYGALASWRWGRGVMDGASRMRAGKGGGCLRGFYAAFAIVGHVPMVGGGWKLGVVRVWRRCLLCAHVSWSGKTAVIPPRANRQASRHYDRDLFKARRLIENFFARFKQFRAIAIRYDKTTRNYLGAIHLAAAVIWLN
jgi:Transposase DDE domain